MARRRRLTPAQPGASSGPEGSRPPLTGPLGAAPARTAPIAQVSGQSAEAAALREVTESVEAARAQGRMVVEVPLGEVDAEFLMRDRIALDRDDLDELKASIRTHGQRVPVELVPLAEAAEPGEDATGQGTPSARFGLVSGWRRLTALRDLYADTAEPHFGTVRALIRPIDATPDIYVAMIEENEIRAGLSYYERARMVTELTRRGVFADEATALRTLFASASRAKRSKIGSFTELVATLDDTLSCPAQIPERLGLALVARLRARGVEEICAALRDPANDGPEAELAILHRLARPQPQPRARVSRAKHVGEEVRPGLVLEAAEAPGRLALTLRGPAANAALLQQIRSFLRG